MAKVMKVRGDRDVQAQDVNEESGKPQERSSLNFKVTSEFKKEFKGYAVAQGMSMTELLIEGFELSKLKKQK